MGTIQYIGNIECDFIHGAPAMPHAQYAVWETPGVNGYGVRHIGVRADRTNLECVKFTSRLAAIQFAQRLRLSIGTKCLVHDDLARTYYLWIEKVGTLEVTPAVMPCDKGVEVRASVNVTGIVCS